MAKTSMIEREKRREKLVKQHAAKRAKLKEIVQSVATEGAGDDDPGQERYRLTLAYYPLETTAHTEPNRHR